VTASPTPALRKLGAELRKLRTALDLTVEEVAAELLCSATKITRMETGYRPLGRRDLKKLCTLYGVDNSTKKELAAFAREARKPGWWTQYEELEFTSYVGLETNSQTTSRTLIFYEPFVRDLFASVRDFISPIRLLHSEGRGIDDGIQALRDIPCSTRQASFLVRSVVRALVRSRHKTSRQQIAEYLYRFILGGTSRLRASPPSFAIALAAARKP
jgi:transcriptional regulator with XRE-family HTH domain